MEKLLKMPIDLEWAQLILEAKRMGFTIEEIREFLRQKTPQKERAAQ